MDWSSAVGEWLVTVAAGGMQRHCSAGSGEAATGTLEPEVAVCSHRIRHRSGLLEGAQALVADQTGWCFAVQTGLQMAPAGSIRWVEVAGILSVVGRKQAVVQESRRSAGIACPVAASAAGTELAGPAQSSQRSL